MKRLNAEKLAARLNPDRKVPRRKKQIASLSVRVLDEPHLSADEVEIELGESEEWDEASEEGQRQE